AIKEFFASRKSLGEVNATLITLVPKINTPQKVFDFRPIACCNVVYKCISKILNNRIKNALCKLVNQNQSAFIPGRQITNNILITQELLRGYNWKNGVKRVAINIDIQKAYDTVSWSFLEKALILFGFHEKMVKWIMVCVSTAAFTLCVNGERHGYFKGRVETTGSYLSLYLYTGHGDIKSVEVVKNALDMFSLLSGLNPNLGKSTVFFRNIKDHIKQEILSILRFKVGRLHGPLSDYIPKESIVAGNLCCEAKVADIVYNGKWKIPNTWLSKYHVLQNMHAPKLKQRCNDTFSWVENDGRRCRFSVKNTWNIMVQGDEKVRWYGLLWFSQCIPKHTFILWLAVQKRLSTQDRLARWYPSKTVSRSLCNECPNSHEHLFFECKYSKKVWEVMKKYMEQEDLNEKWNEILTTLMNLPCNRNIMSVIRRLVLAASVYFILQERNRRLFGELSRNWTDLVKVIMNTIRLRMAILKVKSTT
ncbi:RNA-directed DNA polymerase, eukaryota, reverse transcriptase zinc-binding domain protein, partial [Tanacetum coccineum]